MQQNRDKQWPMGESTFLAFSSGSLACFSLFCQYLTDVIPSQPKIIEISAQIAELL